MEVCRACLSSASTLKIFDDLCLYKYKTLTSLTVEINDGLPHTICSVCLACLESYASFREQCINSENSLKNMILECKIKQEDTKLDYTNSLEDIKQELNEFESSFDFDNVSVDLEDRETVRVKKDLEPKEIKTSRQGFDRKVKKIKSNNDDKKENKTCQPGNKLSKLKTFNCGLCKEVFKKREALIDHLNSHKSNLVCLICKKDDFISWQALIAHRFNHIDNNEKYCHMCTTKYNLEAVLLHHYLTDHSDKKPLKNTCLCCERDYETHRKLVKHISQAHTTKKYICDNCGKVNNSRHKLKQHLLMHLEKKPHKCKLCNMSYKRIYTLKNHILREHGKSSVSCKTCSKYFESEETKSKHTCNAASMEVCQVCGKFMNRRAMLHHKKSHENTFFECKLCPLKLKTKTAFKAHTDRHKGTPSYKCKYCPQAFYSGSTLIKHTRTHTGEKPYVCNLCGRAFTGNHNLKVHMKVHGLDLVKKVNKDEAVVKDE